MLRGRWGKRWRKTFVAEGVVEGYVISIRSHKKMDLIKPKELEKELDWQEAPVTDLDPKSWYPGGIFNE